MAVQFSRRFVLGAALAALSPKTARSAPLPSGDPLAKVGHVVVVYEENRSFDNLFALFPGADGLDNALKAPPQVGASGAVLTTLPRVIDSNRIPPGPDPRFPEGMPNRPFLIDPYVPQNQPTGDLVHRFYQEQEQIDGGRMDAFASVCDAGGLTMGYYDGHSLAQWRLASEFTLGDRMFHSAFGGSLLNHTFMVCPTPFVWPDAPASTRATLDAHGHMLTDGQVTPDGFVINTSRSVFLPAPSDIKDTPLVPPQTMPHIGDRLDARGITWAWYAGGYADARAGHPDPLFQFHHQPLAYFANLAPGTPAERTHLRDLLDLYQDIEAGTLPQVTFYKPIGSFDHHPGYANIADSDTHLEDLVNELRKSPAWADTLLIITYDENGGLWDHVAPPKRDRWGPGSRVPLIIAGPMVKRGFIDHTAYDFGSILRTIEERFDLEPLRDADAGATSLRAALQ